MKITIIIIYNQKKMKILATKLKKFKLKIMIIKVIKVIIVIKLNNNKEILKKINLKKLFKIQKKIIIITK